METTLTKEAEITPSNMPKCVAFVMDGNRKFSRKIAEMPHYIGHRFGIETVRNALSWCCELGIRHVVLYAFSTENFNRPKDEFDFIMDLFVEEFEKIIRDPGHDAHKHRVRIKFVGGLDLLPEKVRKTALATEEATSKYSEYYLYVAMAYGGRAEIVDACKKIASKVSEGRLKLEEIDEEVVRSNLYAPEMPDPDLIIRTGGEKRTSNFLPWQSAYSELVFVEKCWPELTRGDFYACIREYQRRKRNFGV